MTRVLWLGLCFFSPFSLQWFVRVKVKTIQYSLWVM